VPGVLAFDPFMGETKVFVETDRALVIRIHEEFHPDQTKVVVGDVKNRCHELAPDAVSLEIIMNHDVHDLPGMVHAAVIGKQCCGPNDAAINFCHEFVIIRAETLNLALEIQSPLRWDVQRAGEGPRLMAECFHIGHILDPHRTNHHDTGHHARSLPILPRRRGAPRDSEG
jgi:hypothetical protein